MKKRCNCTSGCQTSRCSCKRNKIACSTHCHPSQVACKNTYEFSPQQPTQPNSFGVEFTDDQITQAEQQEWFSDRHITGALINLKSTFPGIDGLQDTVLQQNKSWEIPKGEYVQIFNVNDNHWVTTSNIGADANHINIFDSQPQRYSLEQMDMFARYHHSTSDKITFNVMNVQKQKNSFDCGPFALAFATSLLHAQDPTQLVFMDPRAHLISCFNCNELGNGCVWGQYHTTRNKHNP